MGNESSDWDNAPPGLVITTLTNEVRTFLTSVGGWAEIIANHPDLKSVEIIEGKTLQQGMEGLLHQMEELQHRLETAALYAHEYEKRHQPR